MVSGLIASQHVSLGKIADHQPGKIYSLSQVKKNERWLDNGLIDADTFFTPLIIKIIHGIILQEKELVFIIDGSVVGKGCQTLMLSVLWKKKAIPIVWKTIQAPKTRRPQVLSRIRPFTLVKTFRGYLKTTSKRPLCDAGRWRI